MVIFSFYKYSNDDRTFSGTEENSLKVSRTKKKKKTALHVQNPLQEMSLTDTPPCPTDTQLCPTNTPPCPISTPPYPTNTPTLPH